MDEFKNVARKALERIETERPRVAVPAYVHRKGLVEQAMNVAQPHPETAYIILYSSLTQLPEAHRVAVLFAWMTGYGEIPLPV